MDRNLRSSLFGKPARTGRVNRRFFSVWIAGVVGALTFGSRRIFAEPIASLGATQTEAAVTTAATLLATLSGEQRNRVRLSFPTQQVATAAHFKGGKYGTTTFTGEQYGEAMWSNFPVSDVPRPGLRMGDLNPAQQQAAMTLLRALLSESGYRKVNDIMGSDQALADSGVPYAAGRAAYTLVILGEPHRMTPWMVQFGGHHLALNITIAGERAVLAPVLTGALPAIYTDAGRTMRALAAENDKAFALLHALTDDQRRAAIIQHGVSDLVLGPGHDGEVIASAGLKGSAMDNRQQAMLFDLILEWAGMLHDAYTAPRLAEIRAGLPDTFFAWSGPTDHAEGRNGASYFRITGPQLAIEFAPQEPGGDLTMHVHTVYRDPANAYGRAVLEQRGI